MISAAGRSCHVFCVNEPSCWFVGKTHSASWLQVSVTQSSSSPAPSPSSSSSSFLLHLWWVWSLNSGLCTTAWATPPVHFALVILEMGSHELFAWIFQISASQDYRCDYGCDYGCDYRWDYRYDYRCDYRYDYRCESLVPKFNKLL
jgi:hypothetical protein